MHYSPGILPQRGTRGSPHFPLLSLSLSPSSPSRSASPPIAAQPRGLAVNLISLPVALSVFGYYY